MEEASKIALISGFGGVVLGGVITFTTEWMFRRNDRHNKARSNFILSMIEIGRVYDELVSIYRALSSELGAVIPPLISSRIRPMVSTAIQPSALETEKLLAVNHKKNQIFSDLKLILRRFNSRLSTFEAINHKRAALNAGGQRAGHIVPVGEQDIGQLTINPDDDESVMAIVTIENLYRDFFRSLISDIEHCEA